MTFQISCVVLMRFFGTCASHVLNKQIAVASFFEAVGLFRPYVTVASV